MLQVNWDSEKGCFDTFAREVAEFYCIKKQLFPNEPSNSSNSGGDSQESQEVSTSLHWRDCFRKRCFC